VLISYVVMFVPGRSPGHRDRLEQPLSGPGFELVTLWSVTILCDFPVGHKPIMCVDEKTHICVKSKRSER